MPTNLNNQSDLGSHLGMLGAEKNIFQIFEKKFFWVNETFIEEEKSRTDLGMARVEGCFKKYTFIEDNDVDRTDMDGQESFFKKWNILRRKINRTDMNMVGVGEYLKKYVEFV